MMSVICFVCNLPILSHQVCLLWEGGNGWDDIQSDDSVPRSTRVGRRDSSAQISTIDPPSESQETSSPTSRRRRSSIAQFTDIIRDWGRRDTDNRSTSTSTSSLARRESREGRNHRESLVEIAKSLPWGGRRDSVSTDVPRNKMRRESSAEVRKRRQSGGTDIRSDIAKIFTKRESVGEIIRRRRDSIEQEKKERRDSTTQVYSRAGRTITESVSPEITTPRITSPEPPKERDLIPRTIVTTQTSAESAVSLVSHISTNVQETSEPHSLDVRSPLTSPVPTSPTPTNVRRDSTQHVRGRRDSRPQVSPDRSSRGSREPSPKFRNHLRRQSTAIEEGPITYPRRDSRPFLLPDASETDGLIRKLRRDSLSPDSAAAESIPSNRKTRRDSRPRLSPEPSDSNSRETSPRSNLRRQSTTAIEYAGRGRRSSRSPRSPDSSSTCSSREHSPKPRLRRQSTTEEILKSTGFRRQSTTEDIMRARNFRRQSTQSEEMSKSRGRRDSCAQITDGTLATMTIETSSAFFDTSTQTGKSVLFNTIHDGVCQFHLR